LQPVGHEMGVFYGVCDMRWGFVIGRGRQGQADSHLGEEISGGKGRHGHKRDPNGRCPRRYTPRYVP